MEVSANVSLKAKMNVKACIRIIIISLLLCLFISYVTVVAKPSNIVPRMINKSFSTYLVHIFAHTSTSINTFVKCCDLFHDKKCGNCFNFVLCILWDFIVLGLVLSWWRIEHVLDEQVDFASVSWEANLRKSHVRSTCWKLKSCARLLVSRVSREKG